MRFHFTNTHMSMFLLIALTAINCASNEPEGSQGVVTTECVETSSRSFDEADGLETRLLGTWDQCYSQLNVDSETFAICDFQDNGVMRQIHRQDPTDPDSEPGIDLYEYRIMGQQLEVRVANKDGDYGMWATLDRIDPQTAYINGYPEDALVHWNRVACTGYGFDE